MTSLQNAAETFALNQWLSDFPVDMSFDEILDLLHTEKYLDSDDIIVWEPVEDYPGADIAEMMKDTYQAFIRHASELMNETEA